MLLIRNTDWAREFFADVAQYAYMPKEELMSTMRPVRSRPEQMQKPSRHSRRSCQHALGSGNPKCLLLLAKPPC